MRGFIAALCLVVVGVVLEGCGGGSSTTCINKQIDIVSQSITGTAKSAATVTVNATKVSSSSTAEITEKVDLEKWNMRMDITTPVKQTLPGLPPMDLTIEAKVILMVSKKMGVVWHKMTNNTDGKVVEQGCETKALPPQVTPEMLSLVFNQLKTVLQAKATCGGNDGTYDTWKMEQSYDGAIPAIPGVLPHPPAGSVDGTISAKYEMDKDFLVNSASVDVNAKADMKGQMSGHIEVTSTSSFDVSKVSKGGPADSDLDYSGWGECKPAPDSDINTLFLPAKGSKASPFLNKISGHGFFQKHIMDAMQASLKSQAKSSVIV